VALAIKEIIYFILAEFAMQNLVCGCVLCSMLLLAKCLSHTYVIDFLLSLTLPLIAHRKIKPVPGR
jgi:hypothetical protein